jgi:hypothetical protein
MLAEVAKRFAQFLEMRLRLGTCQSEDCVRYSFFAALLDHGVPQERVVLEFSHPAVARKKIDAVVLDGDLRPVVCIEFKYDRIQPSETNQARTYKAGVVFSDFVKLLSFPGEVGRFVVYLTDGELARYFRNSTRLSAFFDLQPGRELIIGSEWFRPLSATFRDAVKELGRWPGNVAVTALLRQEFRGDRYLRVYSVGQVRSDSGTPSGGRRRLAGLELRRFG